jgi:hypothetical protein
MEIRWAALVLICAIHARNLKAAEPIEVEIYVQNGNWPQPLKYVEKQTSQIFQRIEVRLTWHTGDMPADPPGSRRSIGIRFLDRAPASISPFAMASARPFGSSGSLISIYADRVQDKLRSAPRLWAVLLAHVLVHELAHVMQGTDYHSPSGIMKANWSNADYDLMCANQLGFTDWDGKVIHGALAARLASR